MQISQLNQNMSVYNRAFEGAPTANIFLSKIVLFYRRHQTRKQLSRLSPTQLHDIGISREEALAESQQPFWK